MDLSAPANMVALAILIAGVSVKVHLWTFVGICSVDIMRSVGLRIIWSRSASVLITIRWEILMLNVSIYTIYPLNRRNPLLNIFQNSFIQDVKHKTC